MTDMKKLYKEPAVKYLDMESESGILVESVHYTTPDADMGITEITDDDYWE